MERTEEQKAYLKEVGENKGKEVERYAEPLLILQEFGVSPKDAVPQLRLWIAVRNANAHP